MDIEIDLDEAALAAAVPDLSVDPSAAFALFLDTAAIHRTNAEERGFSAGAAETMAVALHAGLVAAYFTQVEPE